MSVSVTFFSLISQLIDQVNQGLHEAIDVASDEPQLFVVPKIEVELKCLAINNNGTIEIIPSNGAALNQYGIEGDSKVSLEFKLKP